MERLRSWYLAAICVFMFSAAAHAQTVVGRVYRTYAQYGTCCYANFFTMKWCKQNADGTPNLAQCGSAQTTQYGDFTVNVGWGSGYYFPYLFRDDVYWGSSTYPIAYPAYFQAGVTNLVGGTLESRPRALPPNAVYPPSGAVNVPTTIVLQWTDGLDADRRRNDWPVTYDIYGSGNEFPEIKEFDNLPCLGSGNGVCNIAINNLTYTTRYQWRVVARMHSGPIVQSAGLDNSYYTSSATFRFSTTWDPTVAVYTISTANGNLIKANGGGGDGVDATGTASSYETQFHFVDANGGSLLSGDPIYIQTNRNYYISAVNGGGSGINAIPAWTMDYERWTIERVAGCCAISPGDQVAFRSFSGGYYMSAVNGGGSSMNAAATGIGPSETFTFR
jgi:hypothetical protein